MKLSNWNLKRRVREKSRFNKRVKINKFHAIAFFILVLRKWKWWKYRNIVRMNCMHDRRRPRKAEEGRKTFEAVYDRQQFSRQRTALKWWKSCFIHFISFFISHFTLVAYSPPYPSPTGSVRWMWAGWFLSMVVCMCIFAKYYRERERRQRMKRVN